MSKGARTLIPLFVVLGFVVLGLTPISALAAEREIEEIIVTAEKRESTVSDTSIAITAFSQSMIEDFGIQGANELVNFTPATTRDPYDIRIRGVGRNFRALGGDPGIATYYNGVYSEDFGIAASENGLYDVARIEVLRGPQGTLYGRNAIGGAINYLSNKPTFHMEGEGRIQVGEFNTVETYGVISGPIKQDLLAGRMSFVKRTRDGSMAGQGASEDVNSINDYNLGLSLLLTPTDNLEFYARWNDRESDRIIGTGVLLNEGPAGNRGFRDRSFYAQGFTAVAAGGQFNFVDPADASVTISANRPRPGIDVAASAAPNPAFGDPNAKLNNPGDAGRHDVKSINRINRNNDETFDHNAVSFEATWDVGSNLTFKYIYGYSDFDYTFDLDVDNSSATWTDFRFNVLEDAYTWSHELQILWSVGEKLIGTSGIYGFYSNRRQDFGIHNPVSSRYTQAVDYGFLDDPQFLLFLGGTSAVNPDGCWICFAFPDSPLVGSDGQAHHRKGDAAVGTSPLGLWQGDEDPNCQGKAYQCDPGSAYDYQNDVRNQSYAVFTQVEYEINQNWYLTLGLRYAQDEKDAAEDITLYFEDNADTGFLAGVNGFLPFTTFTSFGAPLAVGPATGLTNLAALNVLMGNATLNYDPFDPSTFNPAQPITPVCDLQDANCAHPLRLQGIPYNLARKTRATEQYDHFTWRVNLDWVPNDDHLVYASVTTGYRAGGFSVGIFDTTVGDSALGTLTPSSYGQETVITYELGYKASLLDRQLQMFATLYRYDYDDYQDRIDVTDPLTNLTSDIVQNAPEAANQGFELELTWLATDNFTIGGNYSYTDTKYTEDYFVTNRDDPATPPNIFGSAADRPDLHVFNVNGNALKRIPTHKSVLWGVYTFRTDIGELDLSTTWAYTGAYYASAIERSFEETPSRNRVDVALQYTSLDDMLTVRAFVDNVFDVFNLNAVNTGSQSGNFTLTGEVLYPRYFGFDVTYRFGEG